MKTNSLKTFEIKYRGGLSSLCLSKLCVYENFIYTLNDFSGSARKVVVSFIFVKNKKANTSRFSSFSSILMLILLFSCYRVKWGEKKKKENLIMCT